MLQAFDELPDAVRYGLAFGIPCLVTLFATPFVARAAIRLGLVDHPAPHKTHVDPTPYLGGAAVAAGIGVTGVVAAGGSIQIATILVAAIAIACLGLVDDARGLQPPVKLAVEAAAAVALYVTGSGGGVFGTAVLDLPLTIVWVVVVTNALNLLDNMDGLAPASPPCPRSRSSASPRTRATISSGPWRSRSPARALGSSPTTSRPQGSSSGTRDRCSSGSCSRRSGSTSTSSDRRA